MLGLFLTVFDRFPTLFVIFDFFYMILFDVNITFGNRSTRRIDPRTPEAPISQ